MQRNHQLRLGWAMWLWWTCLAGQAWSQTSTSLGTECASATVPYSIFVDEKGTPSTMLFGTAVDFDTIGYPIERVHIEIVREDWTGKMDTAIFHYGGMWQVDYRDTTAERWARMLAPKVAWKDEMAVGKVSSGCFVGQVDVDKRYKNVHIHGVIRRIGAGPLIGEWRFTTQLQPAKLVVPMKASKTKGFHVIPDKGSNYYLIKGHVHPKAHFSVYMVDDRELLAGVITEPGQYRGRYRRVLEYGNALDGNYFLHVRIGDSLQVIPIPKY